MSANNVREYKKNVYNLTNSVEALLDNLSGTTIEADVSILKTIESLIQSIEKQLVLLQPTQYEIYSKKARECYEDMKNKEKLYKLAIKSNNQSAIKIALNDYSDSTKKYILIKEARNKFKQLQDT